MAEVNGTDHLVRHEKESKLNGYDNEGYHCQERSEDEEESASDDDRLRVVVTENGRRPEDDPHMSNGYVHDDTNSHSSTTVNGSAVIVIEENKSDSNMNDNKEDNSFQKPLDTRLHHFVPVDDIDRKILNGSDATHVTIPEDAVINFTTGRVKVRKGSSNNPQVSNERESIPLETMLPSYETEDKVAQGEKAELEAELTNHKNGLWSEGHHNTYGKAESHFSNSEKLNGTSKSGDEIALPVNNHRKCLRGEKLYFTDESRKLCPGWRRVFVCGLILIIIAVALLLGVLAATGILLAESESKNSRYESGHPSQSELSQAGHSFRPRLSSKVPQKPLPSIPDTTTIDPVSRTSSPAVTSKVPVLNNTSHSQTFVPNALVGEFTIDENFTDDLKDNTSYGYQSLAKYIERELHGIFKRSGGVFELLKILSFSPGSIKVKFLTIWASDRNIINSTKAVEIFKSYLKKNRNSLLAYPVDLDNIHFIDVFDECRVQKGGCSFRCVWDYNTLSKTCACEEGMILLDDGKSCGPRPSTSAYETTTPKFINRITSVTPMITTDLPLIKEDTSTTKGQAETTPNAAIIPTIVTKTIISITELFHNLTSTASPVHVTELLNLSTVTEHLTSDVQTTAKSYSSGELPTTEKSTSVTDSIKIPNESTTEFHTIANNPSTEDTEKHVSNESDVTETNTPFSVSQTTPTSAPELEITTTSPFMNPNNSVALSEQPTTILNNMDLHIETTTNSPLTEHTTTRKDLTTIGYHIKEETTEMYTLEDNTEFETTFKPDIDSKKPETSTTKLKTENNIEFETTIKPDIDTEKPETSATSFKTEDNIEFETTIKPDIITEKPETTTTNFKTENNMEFETTVKPDITSQKPARSTTDFETEDNIKFETTVESDIIKKKPAIPLTNFATNNQFFPDPTTRSITTSEVTQLPEIHVYENASEATDLSYNQPTETTIIAPNLETTTMNFMEENATDINDFLNMTEQSNEKELNDTNTEFTLTGDDLNETHFKSTESVDRFITTTFEPLTVRPQPHRTPEVRSFHDLENDTTTQNININNNNISLNSSSPETIERPDEKETLKIVNSSTTSLPTTESHDETTLFESTTKKSVADQTTLSVPDENKPTTSTSKNWMGTTLASEKSTEDDGETMVNSDLTSTSTEVGPHANRNHNVELDTTATDVGEEPITETKTHNEINASDTTEAENETLENDAGIITTLFSAESLENSSIHNSNNSETTESISHSKETTTNSYTEITIPETTHPDTENSFPITFTENSTNEGSLNSSSTLLNNTDNEFLLSSTSEPMNVSDELTTLKDTLEDLTSLETSNFSNTDFTPITEIPTNVTPNVSLDFNDTLMLTIVQNYTLPTPPRVNESEVETTTESIYDTEMHTFTEYDNETMLPFDMDSNFTNTTDMPFENPFLDINSTIFSGSNESLENSTFLDEFVNFTTEGYDAANETTTNASTGVECREDQFLCEPLNRCINDTFMCDGIEDCPDGRDEFECKDTCHSNFMCANSSTCIMSEARCDGIWDCENGTDEDNCSPTECAQHEVMCLDHSKCIKPGHICDWKYNCLDRSDEVGCVERTTCESNGRFFCNDGLCIPWSLKCDGEHDCKEGEDEGNCTCLSDEFQCNDGKCLKSSSRCDGHQDCHDADDEMGCVTVDSQHIVSTYEPYSGTWGLLCAEDWNLDDGQYLCQELGFGHALNVERIHVSFNGTWMAMRRENLTEASLWTERVSFVESCTSGFAAAVECQKFVCGEYTGLLHRRKRDVISSSSNPWPFIGYTSTFRTNKGCLSEILTPIWLITSAECLLSLSKEPFNGSDWYVRTNIGRNIEAGLVQNHEVLRIINHPHSSKFRSLTLRDYDVALIRLKHALVFVSDKIGAICPPEEQVPPGITCFSGVLGTEKPRAPPPPVLTINSLALQITDKRNCNRVEHFNNAVNQRMLCTQSSEGHTICDNDEGTPLMCLTGINKWFLAGMLTYQRFCDVYSKHPAVFSNLFSMRKFLDQVIGQKQYEVSYDGTYIIIPPTTPSPTMPETTTPEITTVTIPEFSVTNETYLTGADFENGTETILDNLEEINGTTEMNEELTREENYTTQLPEELMGHLNNTTINESDWNETVTTPYEIDTGADNTTLKEFEKHIDEVSTNRMHDHLMSLLNDTYSDDDTANDTTVPNAITELSNTTPSPTLETTTISLDSTNTPIALLLNSSLDSATEFTTSDSETTALATELSTDETKADTNITDTTTDATITANPHITSNMNDSAEYLKFTTSSVDPTTTDLISAFNDTIEMFKPISALTNESKVISQPLISLINDTMELESPTTMSSGEGLDNTENIKNDTTLIELQGYTHHSDADSETTPLSITDTIDFNPNTTAETTTQPILDETDVVTFDVEGEPDADMAFSFYKNPDGLKVESYRMLEDSDLNHSPEENVSITTKQDYNVDFTTEGGVTLMPPVTTTISHEHFMNESMKDDLIFSNATDNFNTESIASTSANTHYSINLNPETRINSDEINGSFIPSFNMTEKDDDENTKDEVITESEDLLNDDFNYSMPLFYENDSPFDMTNKTSLSFSNETDKHDLIFYNVTKNPNSKLASSIIDNVNDSNSFASEDDSKSDITNKSLSFVNDTEKHDLTFNNVSDKTLPKYLSPNNDDMNYSLPFTFVGDLKLGVRNISSSDFIEKPSLELNSITNESFDPIIEDVNSSVPLNFRTFEENIKADSVNTSLLSSDNTAESRDLEMENNAKEFIPKSESLTMDDKNRSLLQSLESNNTNAPSLSRSHNVSENYDIEFDNGAEEFIPKSESLNVDNKKPSISLTLENDNTNLSSLSHPHNFTENYGLEFDNGSEVSFPKSESLIIDDMNPSPTLTLKNSNTNTSSLSHTNNLTENYGLELDNSAEELFPKSEGAITDTFLTLEKGNTNASQLSYSSNLTEGHGPTVDNVTDKIIPKSVNSMISDTINYSMPLLFDEIVKPDSMNESLINDENNKTIPSVLEAEVDAPSVEDSIMKLHLTTKELNILPDTEILPKINDCGNWPESYTESLRNTMNKSHNQNPFKLWPAIGHLQMTSESKTCPTTIVSPKYVMTSLNCLTLSNEDLEPDKWTYIGGSVTSEGIQNITVNEIIPYPGISLLLNEHDVALVRMNGTIDMNEYSKSACVVQRESEPGKECFTAGWNKNASDVDLQNQFYSFPLTIISTEECNNTNNYNGMLIDDLICGVQRKENIQSCYMDFGSPLFCLNENKQWEIHGILNLPSPCDMTQPFLFSNILSIRKWINQTLTNDEMMHHAN